MESFNSTDGWYEGRPVACGSTPQNRSSARSSPPTKTSITRTGLSAQIQSSRHSGNRVLCPRSIPSTKRFIRSLPRESHRPARFYTWGNSGIEPYPGPGNQLSKDRQGPNGALQSSVGIARIMQGGWYKEVRVKGLDSHAIKALLVSRALLVKIKRDLENQIRGLLKNFGLGIGRAKMNVFAVRAAEMTEDRPELAG